jgi:hypothetical protein
VPGSTSTDDVVLYDHCQQHPISYSVQLPPGTSFWRLRVTVHDPHGNTSQGNVFTGGTSATSGTFDFQLCGSEPTGTWTVEATGFTQVVPLVEIPFTLPDTTFEVRPMATRTRLAERRARPGHARLVTTVRQQGEHRYVRADGVTIRLERRAAGHWQRVRGLTLTTVHGRAVAVVEAPGTYRAVVPGHGNLAPSRSGQVRVG